MIAGRPTIVGSRHAVSAGHYLAAAAGMAILEAGGNAIDAVCAGGLALGVVLSDMVGVAGVAPMIIRLADGRVETIAGLGHWPRSIPADLFQREHGGQIPEGVLRMIVPAAPDAWITALERHGTMGFAEIAEPAIRFAAEGFAVTPLFGETLAANAASYARWPQNAAIYLPGGQAPKVGDRFVQTDLAATLTFLADEDRRGRAAGGRLAGLKAAHAAFYRGDIARRIAEFVQSEGGYLSRDDMADFRPRLEPVVARRWRGHEVMVCGPWCQGPSLLEALLLMERTGLDGLDHNSVDYLHQLVECLKIALADREYHFTDPAFAEVPLDALLGEAHLAARVAEIDPARAHPDIPEPLLTSPAASMRLSRAGLPTIEADTSYVAAVDRWGNAVSATPSDGSWNGPVVPGLGLVPSCRGSQSRPDPRHPAGVAPGIRPRLTPNPAMVVTRDGGVMPLGTPGGDVQIQAMLQVLLNRLHFGMDLQEAIEAPRVASYANSSSFAPFESFPGRLAVEARISQDVRNRLAARGHRIHDWPERTWLAGSVEAVEIVPRTGLRRAGADPRRPAYAVAM